MINMRVRYNHIVEGAVEVRASGEECIKVRDKVVEISRVPSVFSAHVNQNGGRVQFQQNGLGLPHVDVVSSDFGLGTTSMKQKKT